MNYLKMLNDVLSKMNLIYMSMIMNVLFNLRLVLINILCILLEGECNSLSRLISRVWKVWLIA